MKKRLGKLKISRETIRILNDRQFDARGGLAITLDPFSNCTDSCFCDSFRNVLCPTEEIACVTFATCNCTQGLTCGC